MIQGSYRETGAHGKWLDKSLAKSLQDINMKWPIDERDNTHVVKDGIRIACEDVCDSRLNGWDERGEDSTRTSMVILDFMITVACI